MRIAVFTAAAFAAVFAAAPSAGATFDGEVLVAPPPANWMGGTLERTDTGSRRIWQRNVAAPGTAQESITLSRFDDITEPAPSARAAAIGRELTAECAKPIVSQVTLEGAEIGAVASVTSTCEEDGGATLFSVAKAYLGEFNSYAVVRTWRGDPRDPGNPANSPKTAASWLAFFDRISVCNALTAPCDTARAEIIHADPRFEQMRALHISEATVLPQDDVLKAARGLGELTGRAEQCGEDVSPLVSKIDRMFESVTGNDTDSNAAAQLFRVTQQRGNTLQQGRDHDTCGPVLRDFRQHPSRVGAFARYIEQFF